MFKVSIYTDYLPFGLIIDINRYFAKGTPYANYKLNRKVKELQMKKTIKILCSLFLLLSVVGCGSGSSSKKEELEGLVGDNDSSNIYGYWIIKGSVDEFGDEIKDGISYVATVGQNADFSNTATSSSKLTPIVIDSVPGVGSTSVHVFFFSLQEYGDTPATYYKSSKMILKYKVDDKVEQYTLIGTEPNGNLILGLADYGGDKLYQHLMDGKDVKCIITIDNSKYNFTIMSAGFAEAWNSPDKEKEKQQAEALIFSNTHYLNSQFQVLPFVTDRDDLKPTCRIRMHRI